MSRSYKHVPCAHFVCRHRGMKRLFNKRVRRLGIDSVGSHGNYRKANEVWDDDDFRAVHLTAAGYRRLLAHFGVELEEEELARAYRRAFIAK